MTETEFKSIVAELRAEWEHVGLRGQDLEFEPEGETIKHQSSRWNCDEYDEDAEVYDGVCCLSIDTDKDLEFALDAFELFGHKSNPYYGCYIYDHIAIIVGDYATSGQDFNEVVIEDAMVAKVVM